MIKYTKFFIMITFAASLLACAANSQRLSDANEKTPINDVNAKLQKHINKLYSDDATERAWAVYNIGKSAKLASNTVPYLIALLNDSEIAVMSRYVGRDYTSATTTTTANEAVKVLGKIGKPAVLPLINALKDPNSDVVIKVIKTLGLINSSESIKPLVTFLSNKDRRIRLEAANSLSRFKNPWVTEYLLKALKNKDPSIRSTVLFSLGKLKSPVAVPTLLELLHDPDESIRSQVLYILGNYRDERIIEPLVKLAKAKSTNANSIKRRIEVINTLGSIRDYRVIEALIVILKDKNNKVRAAAAGALFQITNNNLGQNQAKWKRWWSNKLKRSRNNK